MTRRGQGGRRLEWNVGQISDSLENLTRTDFANFFRCLKKTRVLLKFSCLEFLRPCKFCQREYSQRQCTKEEEEGRKLGRARRKGGI